MADLNWRHRLGLGPSASSGLKLDRAAAARNSTASSTLTPRSDDGSLTASKRTDVEREAMDPVELRILDEEDFDLWCTDRMRKHAVEGFLLT